MADWPAWFYGPNGEAAVFERPADVPPGWADEPGKAEQQPKRRRQRKEG